MDRRTFLGSSAGLAGIALFPGSEAAKRNPVNAPISGAGVAGVVVQRRLTIPDACRFGMGVEVRLEDGRRFFVGRYQELTYDPPRSDRPPLDGFVGVLVGGESRVHGPSTGWAIVAEDLSIVTAMFRGEADAAVHEALLACDALYGSGARTTEHGRAVLACMPRVAAGESLCAHTLNYTGDALRYLLTPVFA